jgi:hypothetical protein
MFAKTYHATHPDMMESVSNDDCATAIWWAACLWMGGYAQLFA